MPEKREVIKIDNSFHWICIESGFYYPFSLFFYSW